MALKVGMRVRRVFTASHGVPAGETGTITGYVELVREYRVAWDRAPWSAMDPQLSYLPESLAPLLPPDSKADEFIAKLKKLGPLPVKEIA